MQQPRKKGKPKDPEGSEGRDQDLLGELADCIVESIKEKQEADPFELYVHQLRARLLEDVPSFRQRLIQGYSVLMEVLGAGRK
jgi:hypothetical protein